MSSLSFDTAHSEIAFSVRHMVFAKVRGSFRTWRGAIEASEAGALTALTVEVDTASIDTREEGRDAHLRSADFFDVANHPSMSFRSTGVRGDTAGRFQIDGELTIRGTTRSVTLEAEFAGGGKDPWGNSRRGYRATARIDRSAFGLTWNQALELGGILVGEQVDIEVETQLVEAARPARESAAEQVA